MALWPLGIVEPHRVRRSRRCWRERDVRPVKIQQRTSGGAWRTLDGIADFAVVQSYLSTATKWGLDTHNVLTQLFTTGAWLPPTPALLNSYANRAS